MTQTVSIRILDNFFNIKCPPEETNQLKQCARYIDEQIRSIRQKAGNNTNSTERLTIMAALNMAHELLTQKNRIESLETKIENILASTVETETS